MPFDVSNTDSVKVMTNAAEVACVYCGRAHLFEEC